jgi:hypothetical protein
LAWQPKTILFTVHNLLGCIFGTQDEIEAAGNRAWEVFEVNPNEILLELPIFLISGSSENATYMHGFSGNATTTGGTAATGSITTIAVASLVDGETFTLDDGVNPARVFELDVTGDGVTAGRVAVDVSGDTTADNVRDTIISVINAQNRSFFAQTASNGGAATVTLTQDLVGTPGNTTQSETVTNAGFVVTNMTTGADTDTFTVPGDITQAASALTGLDVYLFYGGVFNVHSISTASFTAGVSTVITTVSDIPGLFSAPMLLDVPGDGTLSHAGDFLAPDATEKADGTSPLTVSHDERVYLYGQAGLDIFVFYMESLVKAAGVTLRTEII